MVSHRNIGSTEIQATRAEHWEGAKQDTSTSGTEDLKTSTSKTQVQVSLIQQSSDVSDKSTGYKEALDTSATNVQAVQRFLR